MQIFFGIMSVLLVCLVFTSEWFTSKGNLYFAYRINIAKYIGFIILETALALNNPAQMAVLLFNISNIWGLTMSVKGIIRLKKEETEAIKNKKPIFLKD